MMPQYTQKKGEGQGGRDVTGGWDHRSKLATDAVSHLLMATDSHVATGSATPQWTLSVVQPETVPHADRAALEALDDGALVRACLAGQREAFDVVVERHQRQVYRLCYRFVGNHEDASDLSQEVFVRAYRGLSRFGGRAAFGTWLYRIAVNTSLNRAAVRKPGTEPIDARSHIDPNVADPARELVKRATGSDLSAKPLLDHLNRRASELYGV